MTKPCPLPLPHLFPSPSIHILTHFPPNNQTTLLSKSSAFPIKLPTKSYYLGADASSGLRWIGNVAHGLIGMGRWTLGAPLWQVWPFAGAGEEAAAAAEDDKDETATRSHEGHMVRVVGGLICM